jgi:hypothetical protein
VWFIAYRHSLRPDEAGIKFVQSEAETIADRQRLEALGYVITSVAATSKTRTNACLAGTPSDPAQPILG